MGTLRDWLELLRPKHWLKNAFVLMPLPFALAAGGRFDPAEFSLGFVGFCLAASAVYAFNDVLDAEQDRRHPRKQRRPVAAGRVSPAAAVASSVVLLAGGLTLAVLSGSRLAVAILLVYASVNASYSLGAKNVPLLDVFLLSSGFVLRVLLGCALIEVPPSTWLLLCSSTLALFLALAKRRGDLVRGVGSEHRPSLRGYSLGFLNQAIAITAAMTLLAYALYCMEAAVLRQGREFASFPFVLFGVLDYLRMTDLGNGGDSPVELILSSPALWISGALWAVATVWSVGLF
jgi:decaprenyl-phosphate phosphoribosyltransferase